MNSIFKEKTKLMILCLTFSILLIGIASFFYIDNNEVNCNKPINVIYLMLSEKPLASDIANGNTIVVFPEENSLIGDSGILLCPNFRHSDYIDDGGIF